jgi:hypothetical protein
MKRNQTLLIAAGIAIALIIFMFILIKTKDNTQNGSVYEQNNQILKQKLAERDILMSSPIKLKEQEDIQKYCSFFTSAEKHKLVEYCTSTELKDNGGKFLGNIHMIGSFAKPKIILILIQTDPFMSQIDSVKTIFDIGIENLVCDCWDDIKPDNFETSNQWIEGLREFHLGDTKPHSKSKELRLDEKTLQLELSTNQDGYLWHLFIYN